MGAEAFLHAQCKAYLSDIYIWELSGGSREQREAVSKTHRWQQPLRTEDGIYVLVNRLFRKPLCFRFSHRGERIERRDEVVDFPLDMGPGMEIYPAESLRYSITNHVTRAALEGAVEYRTFEKAAGNGRLFLDSQVLEGRLLDVPMFIRELSCR